MVVWPLSRATFMKNSFISRSSSLSLLMIQRKPDFSFWKSMKTLNSSLTLGDGTLVRAASTFRQKALENPIPANLRRHSTNIYITLNQTANFSSSVAFTK